MTKRLTATVLATLMVVTASGCSVDPDEEAPPPIRESVMGVNAQVGDILLRSVHIEAPIDVRYRPGDEAKLWLTLLNDGLQRDTLIKVESPVATSADIYFDPNCDGKAKVVPDLPLEPAGHAPVKPPAGVPPFDAYFVQLQELKREVLAGSSVPVTFSFARAGTVTVEALVQPSNAPRPEASLRCTVETAPTQTPATPHR